MITPNVPDAERVTLVYRIRIDVELTGGNDAGLFVSYATVKTNVRQTMKLDARNWAQIVMIATKREP